MFSDCLLIISYVRRNNGFIPRLVSQRRDPEAYPRLYLFICHLTQLRILRLDLRSILTIVEPNKLGNYNFIPQYRGSKYKI